MLTLNTILKELKNVPVDKLKDLYSIIHSLRANTKKTTASSKQILSFAGAFKDMEHSDYEEFVQETKKTRIQLFDRDNSL